MVLGARQRGCDFGKPLFDAAVARRALHPQPHRDSFHRRGKNSNCSFRVFWQGHLPLQHSSAGPMGYLNLTAIGLDLWTLTFGESRDFPLTPQEIKLFAGGVNSTQVKMTWVCPRIIGHPHRCGTCRCPRLLCGTRTSYHGPSVGKLFCASVAGLRRAQAASSGCV